MSTTNSNFFEKVNEAEQLHHSSAKRCAIAEGCNRYPFSAIVSLCNPDPVHFSKISCFAFLLSHLKQKNAPS